MITAYPLAWPAAWPRTDRPQWSRFAVTQREAQNGILRELKLLGARDIIISTDIPLRQDGLPYASRRPPEDQGVAVYFNLNGEAQCIPCDKWCTIPENMRAIEKTVSALRGLERWGAKEMVNAAFRGFKALPEAGGGIAMPAAARVWHEVLQVSESADWEVVEAAYKRLLHKVHPDKGGSDREFMELQAAFKQAKQLRGR